MKPSDYYKTIEGILVLALGIMAFLHLQLGVTSIIMSYIGAFVLISIIVNSIWGLKIYFDEGTEENFYKWSIKGKYGNINGFAGNIFMVYLIYLFIKYIVLK